VQESTRCRGFRGSGANVVSVENPVATESTGLTDRRVPRGSSANGDRGDFRGTRELKEFADLGGSVDRGGFPENAVCANAITAQFVSGWKNSKPKLYTS
jgi:hypothetical protein